MRAYELMYIINPSLDEEATNGVVDKFSNLIQNQGGEIVKVDRWGKRKLAYEVKDQKEGYYVLVHFNAEATVPREVDRVIKITDNVIRHMIVTDQE